MRPLDAGQRASPESTRARARAQSSSSSTLKPSWPLGEEGATTRPFAGSGLRDDARPGDLERAVLDVDLGERLILAGVPGDVELRLVEQRPHHLAVDDPHLSRVLLDELDRTDRVGFGRCEQLLQSPLQDVGPAERIGGTDDREQVVVLAELVERVARATRCRATSTSRARVDAGTGCRRRSAARPRAILPLSVEQTTRSKMPDCRAVAIAYASSG